MTRITFIVRRLEGHGAERQLVELVTAIDPAAFAVTVVTFYPGGALEDAVKKLPHVTLVCLNKTGRWDVFGFVRRARAVVAVSRPHIIHGYLTMPNLLTLLLCRQNGAKSVWGIRNTYSETSMYGWLGRVELKVAQWTSRFADLAIFNSQAAYDAHKRRGFHARAATVIPNGFDVVAFAPDRALRSTQRAAWNIRDEDRLVGIVGRVNPQKDLETFIDAAALSTSSPLRFVSIGDGASAYGERMRAAAQHAGLGDRMRWSGAVTNMRAVFNALDVLVNSSIDEGMPNVVGEAMACGVACIATDVGDSALLIGPAGIIVPPRDPAAIARAIDALVNDDDERARLGESGRRRIETEYAISHLVKRTEAALAGLIST